MGPAHTPAMPPFAWSASGRLEAAVAHLGQPDVFDFQFERMSPDPAWWRWRGEREAGGTGATARAQGAV